DIQPPYLHFMLEDQGIVPGTFEVTWLVGAAPVVATDDGAGLLKVGGTTVGSIIYATGEVGLRPTTLPDDNSTLEVEYEWSPRRSESFTATADGGGLVSLSLPGAPVRAGSLLLSWQVAMVMNSQPTSPVSVIL